MSTGRFPWRVSRAPRIQRRQYSAPLDWEIPPSKQKYVPKTGTYPKGFSASGVHVGIKPSNTKLPDLAVINSDRSCHVAAVFTKNKFQAAPIQFCKSVLHRKVRAKSQSLIVNSGCANAVTGQQGFDDAQAMSAEVDKYFQRQIESVTDHRTLVMSTGVIGQHLPIEKILSAIPSACSALSSSHDDWLTAARAMCTTDTFPKIMSRQFTLPSTGSSTTYSLAGIAKGSGMIHPRMATLLGVFCTDAPLSQTAAHRALQTAVRNSFNRISVDGDTSTNDTVALYANGAAAPSLAVIPGDTRNSDYAAFEKVLSEFAKDLSHLVVRDGEGATKFVHVQVRNAAIPNLAMNIARSVATSPLVKTALYGKDANWGRIVCAIGAMNSPYTRPETISVAFIPTSGSQEFPYGKLLLLDRGEPVKVDEERAARLLAEEDLKIDIDLGALAGDGKAVFDDEYYFCDFSHEYVTINGDYRT